MSDDIFSIPKTKEIPYPLLLTHPNVPKPLHGLNPRSILGTKWWDEHRKPSYAKFDFHCWACGVHKEDAAFHQWLEGHEHYDINYTTGRVELSEIVALCHSCHNFIHSGRIQAMLHKHEYDLDKAKFVVGRGMDILRQFNLEPFFGTQMLEAELAGRPFSTEVIMALAGDAREAEWGDWRLVIDGIEYESKFKSIEEWFDFYNPGVREEFEYSLFPDPIANQDIP